MSTGQQRTDPFGREMRHHTQAVLFTLALSRAAYATTLPARFEVIAPHQSNGASQKATPKQDEKLSATEAKAYKDALADGRKHHIAKKYKDAVASFEKALTVNPDDRRALSELGYAAYFAKDFSLAEEATRKAIERSSDPGIKGADLYNLGLIQVAQGKNADAIASYTRSLEARPNRTVREALSKLDSAAAARFDPINPIALDGPFASLDAWCQVASKDETLTEQSKGCFTNLEKDPASGLDGPLKAAKVKAPYKEVKIIALTAPLYSDGSVTEFDRTTRDVSYNLAIRTDTGWYVQHNGLYVYNPGAFGIYQEAEFSSIEVKDAIPGGQPEIIYQYKHHASDSDMAGALTRYSTREETVICGVGASGAVSCTNPIVTKDISGLDASLWEAELGPLTEKEFRSEWTLSLSFTTDGQIELKQGTLKGIKSLPKETKAGLGKRALNFP